MKKPVIHSLHLYPVKSCGGVDLDRLTIGPRGGVRGKIADRSWIIADEKGVMISQREYPELARVKITLLFDAQNSADKIRLTAPGLEALILDANEVGDRRQNITLHGKETIGHKAPEAYSAWFSEFLGKPVTLLYQKEEDLRLCSANYAVNPGIDAVSFADGYPYLITTLGTLRALNEKLEDPVPMNRFRPNIVIDDTDAEEEYGWKQIGIGDVAFAFVKPCTRCVMTTVDQETGVKTGKQPLATLAATSFLAMDFGGKRIQGAIFGENAIPLGTGEIAIGDTVDIIDTKVAYLFKRRA